MSDPPRISDDDRDPLASALLRAAQGEAPPARSVDKTLAAIGAGGALLGASKGAAGAATAFGGKLGALTLVKWTGVGAVTGLIAVGALDQAEQWLGPDQGAQPLSAAGVRAGPVGGPTLDRPARTTRHVERAPKPRAEPADDAPAHGDSPVWPAVTKSRSAVLPRAPQPGSAMQGADMDPAVVESALAAEVTLLDAARQALSAGRGRAALEALNRYRAEAKTHRLDPEACYLELEAQLSVGDPQAARRAARRLVDRYPSGPHAARAERILSDQSEAGEGLR